MLAELRSGQKAVSVVGLGYVGLPLALALARHFRVIGFDLDPERIADLREKHDATGEVAREAFAVNDFLCTCDRAQLQHAALHIITVPTPVDESRTPDLTQLLAASRSVGEALQPGAIVVYESTVYPGCTEEDCVPVLEQSSGLVCGRDFTVGYSPERISPGDRERSLSDVVKVVSASDAPTLEVVAEVYTSIVTAGVYRAPDIRVAEAAKVIENSQRDVNISFMNEISIIFHKLGIDTHEVLKAAATKWNFLPFRPGLVGGHCISVDPYYLLHKSIKAGYDPQVIASGRRVNDYMPVFIAKELIKLLLQRKVNPTGARVLVLGLTFKENVTDIRNSRVVDMVRELQEFGVEVDLHDPYASAAEVAREYGLELCATIEANYDAIVVAVAHDAFRAIPLAQLRSLSKSDLLLFDLKAVHHCDELRDGEMIWRL